MKTKFNKVIIAILKKIGCYSFAKRFYTNHIKKRQIIYSNIQRYVIEAGRLRVAICTFGKNGKLVKKALNQKFGIIEEVIIDDNLADYRSKVIPSSDLMNINCSDLFFILTSEDKENRDLFLNNSLGRVTEAQYMYIYDPAINNAPEKIDFFTEIYSCLKVSDVVGFDKYVRIGKNNDGGYIMLDAFSPEQIAYSFGICDDVSWDKDIAQLGIDVYMYDHTIEELPEKNVKFHFFQVGIAGIDKTEHRLLSVETIMDLNGHNSNYNLLLKMDVEGAEWDFLNCTSPETLSHFSQIVFEMHSMTDTQHKDVIISNLEKLNKTHQAVWIHGNNCDYAEKSGDLLMPNALEITYVRRKDYKFCESKRCFPMNLDMPNNPLREDFTL